MKCEYCGDYIYGDPFVTLKFIKSGIGYCSKKCAIEDPEFQKFQIINQERLRVALQQQAEQRRAAEQRNRRRDLSSDILSIFNDAGERVDIFGNKIDD